MSNNTFILAGNATYWTTLGGGVATLTNAQNVAFIFESFSNYPKQIRIRLQGSPTLALSGAGAVSMFCDIPLTALPTWALPAAAGANPLPSGVGNILGGGLLQLTGVSTTVSRTIGGTPSLRIAFNCTATAVLAAAPVPFDSYAGYLSQ